jgi:hypothetical protein
MHASLHRFARSPSLRLLGLFAWLMLVLTALHASPSPPARAAAPAMAGMLHGMPEHAAHAGHAVAAAGQLAGHAQPADCCDGTAMLHCNCAAMCGIVLPAMAAMILPSTPLATIYRPLPTPAAPTLSLTPPLRPPVA